MNQGGRLLIGVLVIAATAAVFFWWRQQQQQPPPAPPPPAPVAAPAAPRPSPDAAPPAVQHPIAPPEPREPLPTLAESDGYLARVLGNILGRKGVQSFLLIDGLIHRVVSTVDNLPRETAAPRLWPVVPTPGRFEAEPSGAGVVVSARNADRYAPFVAFVQSVDTERVAGLYRRLYPLFQQAYEDLGHPGKHFNDRLVEVIDHLLATPMPAAPINVRVAGPADAAAAGKTIVYAFVDPALESSSAGQKILVRMGPANAEKVLAKLRELRRHVARN